VQGVKDFSSARTEKGRRSTERFSNDTFSGNAESARSRLRGRDDVNDVGVDTDS